MSVFQLVGGAGTPIALKITSTSPTVIAEATTGNSRVAVPLFSCTEIAGSTPNLTIDILKPDNTVVYLRNAKAMTAKETFTFNEGVLLLPGWKLRVTSSAADQIDVVGISLIDNT
jgi:hypothetical protein